MKQTMFKVGIFKPLKNTVRLQVKKTLRAIRPKNKVLYNGETIWNMTKADAEFSKAIIRRDGKCLVSGSTENLTCSHFHGRSNKTTRFDPFNCITLALDVHSIWEEEKKEGQVYYEFMRQWLGEELFEELNQRSKEIGDLDTEIKKCMSWVQATKGKEELQEIEF